MIETGQLLQQRYRIDKQIGQGGMGAVYVATDERFGSVVAIKETLCMDDNFRKAIEREARLLNSLKHSALPRVSDHFEEFNSQFLVMEYIPGDDVGAMLGDDNVVFTVDQVLKWADQLLDALDYLHNQESPVIHRDIKPQNLKINSRGEMILLDFGLAKGNPTDASHQTAAKSIFGYSRNYASLEQIQGTGTDPRSDLYSLAATLYHLLTRIAPEDALTRAMAVLSQNPDPLAPANLVNPDVPRGVAGVLQKALDLNASGRPSSASEMRQMFRESENYAYLTQSARGATTVAGQNAHVQPTKLMSEDTRAEPLKPTEMKTELMPAYASELTAVGSTKAAAANITASPQRRNGLGMAAAAIALLFVGAAVAGGIFVMKPSMFGMTSGEEKTPDANAMLPVVANTNTNTNSSQLSSVGLTVPANTGAPLNPETERQTSLDKPAETSKTNKTPNTGKAATQNDSGEIIDFNVDDPEIPAGGVTITQKGTDGKVTTMRVNPIGPPPNGQQPPDGYDPFPRGFDPSKLTPEQRKKLQRVMRGNPRPPMAIPPRQP